MDNMDFTGESEKKVRIEDDKLSYTEATLLTTSFAKISINIQEPTEIFRCNHLLHWSACTVLQKESYVRALVS